jgi:hypothetical protein
MLLEASILKQLFASKGVIPTKRKDILCRWFDFKDSANKA